MPPGKVPFAPSGFNYRGSSTVDRLPHFDFAEYVVPDPVVHTYQVSDVPFPESVVVAVDGDLKRQGDDLDYHVDDDGTIHIHLTGATLAVGQKIIARWCAKEHLVG